MIISIIQNIYNRIIFFNSLLRGVFWKIFIKKSGKKIWIMKGCKIASPSGVEFGHHITIGHHSEMTGAGSLKIGNHVIIGPYCQLLTSIHNYTDWSKPMEYQGINCAPIIIEDDVWLGVNIVVLPNVKIGRGAIVGANAVVTKDVEPYSIIGGVPAKFIKFRFGPEEIAKAMKINYE